MNSGSTSSSFADRLFLWGVTAVPFAIIGAILLYPLGYALYNSFFDLNIYRPFAARFTGLANYRDLFLDARFWASMRVTAIFTFSITVMSVGLGLVLAVALNTVVRGRRLRGMAALRAALLLPFMTSQAVVGAVFMTYFWDGRLGIVNQVLRWLGVARPPSWLSNPDTALWAVIITDTWMMFPLALLVLEAGIRAIPRTLYEAAQIDGASGWHSFRYITLPLITSQLVIVSVLRITHAWRMFDLVFVMTEGGPGRRTEVLSLYIHRTFMRFGEFGYASAMSWAMIVSLALICGAVIFALGRRGVAYAEDK